MLRTTKKAEQGKGDWECRRHNANWKENVGSKLAKKYGLQVSVL